MSATVKLNKKTAAAKLGAKLKEAEAELAGRNAMELASAAKAGPVTIAGVPLESADLTVEYQAEAGWAGVSDRGTQVAIDGRITEELAGEGMARDVIRQIQEHRKNSGLNMEDRISLCLQSSSSKLNAAIDAHRDYIAGETLTTEWAAEKHDAATEVQIDGQSLMISLRKK